MSEPNQTAIRPIVVEIFQSGAKCQTCYLEPQITAGVAKKNQKCYLILTSFSPVSPRSYGQRFRIRAFNLACCHNQDQSGTRCIGIRLVLLSIYCKKVGLINKCVPAAVSVSNRNPNTNQPGDVAELHIILSYSLNSHTHTWTHKSVAVQAHVCGN